MLIHKEPGKDCIGKVRRPVIWRGFQTIQYCMGSGREKAEFPFLGTKFYSYSTLFGTVVGQLVKSALGFMSILCLTQTQKSPPDPIAGARWA